MTSSGMCSPMFAIAPARNRPSGEKARAEVRRGLPWKWRTSLPVATSQRRTVPSFASKSEPQARHLLSGEKVTVGE